MQKKRQFDVYYAAQDVSPSAMLRFLMDQNYLTQSDLPEIGTQGVVSEILNGTMRQRACSWLPATRHDARLDA